MNKMNTMYNYKWTSVDYHGPRREKQSSKKSMRMKHAADKTAQRLLNQRGEKFNTYIS